MKKIYISLCIFLVISLISTIAFASTTSKFEVVEDNVCTIKINDYCTFEKRMINYDLDKRQLTIQLKIKNEAPLSQPTGEVILVLDNSDSMEEFTESEDKRGDLVFGSAKTLISKMLTGNDNLKIGIVSFSTNSNKDLRGTIQDATLVSELTNNITALNTAINSIQKTGSKTNLDSGLTLAQDYFSNEDNNKYIIVLTDGIPNVALNLENNQQGYTDFVINKTKATLTSLSTKYNIITMLTGIYEPDAKIAFSTYTSNEIIEKIFGTKNSPTAGVFHYIEDDKIEETIVTDIYENLITKAQSVKDINIYDYFPQEIVDNFDFAYVSQPTKGTISKSIDSNNRIVWSIDELNSGEEATVQYTLTLKENYNKDIVGVILDTNEKVDITYKNLDDTPGSKTSTDTPKVKVTEQIAPTPASTPTPTPTPTPSKTPDTTVAKTILPKTGSTAIISLAGIILAGATFSGIKLIRINKK